MRGKDLENLKVNYQIKLREKFCSFENSKNMTDNQKMMSQGLENLNYCFKSD